MSYFQNVLCAALAFGAIAYFIAGAIEKRPRPLPLGRWSYSTAIFYTVNPDGTRTQAPTYRRNILGIQERVQ